MSDILESIMSAIPEMKPEAKVQMPESSEEKPQKERAGKSGITYHPDFEKQYGPKH